MAERRNFFSIQHLFTFVADRFHIAALGTGCFSAACDRALVTASVPCGTVHGSKCVTVVIYCELLNYFTFVNNINILTVEHPRCTVFTYFTCFGICKLYVKYTAYIEFIAYLHSFDLIVEEIADFIFFGCFLLSAYSALTVNKAVTRGGKRLRFDDDTLASATLISIGVSVLRTGRSHTTHCFKLVTECRYNNILMIGNCVLALHVVIPFAARANVISDITNATACRCFFRDSLSHAMHMIFDRLKHEFANGANLRGLLRSLCSGSMCGNFTVFTANGTVVIMSGRIRVPNSVIAVTECIQIIGIERVTASQTGFFRITSILASGGYHVRYVIMAQLRNCNCIFIIAVYTSVRSISALRTGSVFLILKHIVVSRGAYVCFIIKIAVRALIFRYTISRTVVFRNNGCVPFVTESCRFRAFDLLSATDTNGISPLSTGRKNGVHVCQIMLFQILTELFRRNRRCNVIREVSCRKRNISVRIRSGNCCEFTVRNIPNNNIIRIFSVKHVRNTYGCRTAEIAYVFGCGNSEIINLFIT